MPMFKAAAELITDHPDFSVELPLEASNQEDGDVVFYQQEPEPEQVVEMHAPPESIEISFKLPFLPGANDEVLEVGGDESEESDEEDDSKDKSKAADLPKDLNWIKHQLDNIPKHKGETLGIERAKSFLTRTLGGLSKLIQEDHDGKIDISKAEDARVSIEDGIGRLDKELQKRKKKASPDDKDISKVASINGVIVTVPILISRIARVCINSCISGGKDIEDIFHRQAKKWKLSDREQVEVIQLITDMGFPVPKLDRGFMVDDSEKYERSSTDNYDYPANYDA